MDPLNQVVPHILVPPFYPGQNIESFIARLRFEFTISKRVSHMMGVFCVSYQVFVRLYEVSFIYVHTKDAMGDTSVLYMVF